MTFRKYKRYWPTRLCCDQTDRNRQEAQDRKIGADGGNGWYLKPSNEEDASTIPWPFIAQAQRKVDCAKDI